MTKCPNCGQRLQDDPIRWPDDYLQLEGEYCDTELRRFEEAQRNERAFGHCRTEVMDKRNEFNDVWNVTHHEKFYISNRGRKE